ncbi:MAG: DNA polymerase III subunit gamma/tau [Alphaproteobacteria bacterium]
MSAAEQPKPDLAKPYLVLARKYRPRTFADLYGQDALVQTLTNAITSGRIHHAYVLTGIRGTGKTTTARILAMALNCENGPATSWPADDPQALAIARGNHPDVLEFDAASNRSVEDMQTLFEGVAYAPTMGRRKVYIIDEVHMLTKHAFNAILKTLEEPPADVTFIFATTEVNKIPVTVLSRCQRFDLRRIPAATLTKLYTDILTKEGLSIAPDALALIARAADGSARDGLSLLDQAIALSSGAGSEKDITLATVADMLGLADRAVVIDILEALLGGNPAVTLEKLDALHARGQDPVLLLTELMHLTDLLTRLKVIPALADGKHLTELERTRLLPLVKRLAVENLARLYQLLLHAVGESRGADRPFEALSMAAVRIAYLASLPSVSDMLKANASNSSANGTAGGKAAAEPKNTEKFQSEPNLSPIKSTELPPPEAEKPLEEEEDKTAPWDENKEDLKTSAEKLDLGEDDAPTLSKWAALVAHVKRTKPALGAVLDMQGRCMDIAKGKVHFSLDKGMIPSDTVRLQLQQVLRESSGEVWRVDIAPEPAPVPTLKEHTQQQFEQQLEAAKDDPAVKELMEIFPGAEVVNVQREIG